MYRLDSIERVHFEWTRSDAEWCEVCAYKPVLDEGDDDDQVFVVNTLVTECAVIWWWMSLADLWQLLFLQYFDQINAALLSRRDFFQTQTKSYRPQTFEW